MAFDALTFQIDSIKSTSPYNCRHLSYFIETKMSKYFFRLCIQSNYGWKINIRIHIKIKIKQNNSDTNSNNKKAVHAYFALYYSYIMPLFAKHSCVQVLWHVIGGFNAKYAQLNFCQCLLYELRLKEHYIVFKWCFPCTMQTLQGFSSQYSFLLNVKCVLTACGTGPFFVQIYGKTAKCTIILTRNN